MRVKLEDVCISASSNLAQKDVVGLEGNYPIYGAAGYIGNVDFYHQEKEYVAVVKDGAGVGRTVLLPAKSSVIGTLQYLLPKENILPEFLLYVVQSMHLEKYYSGATIPHIYFRDYKNEEFDLPNINMQRDIISVLNKVNNIIKQKKMQISLLDDLIKSRFVKLFGDPILNDKCFETILGKNFFKLSNGKAVADEKRITSGIPAYGGNGISWYTDEVLYDGDTLVVGRVGFQSGNVHLAKGPLWVTDNAMYISNIFVDNYNLIFLCALMDHIDFTRYQDAGDLKKITQKPFMQMEFIFPPLELQNQYSSFAEKTGKAKAVIQKSIDEMQVLNKSLIQKYFV